MIRAQTGVEWAGSVGAARSSARRSGSVAVLPHYGYRRERVRIVERFSPARLLSVRTDGAGSLVSTSRDAVVARMERRRRLLSASHRGHAHDASECMPAAHRAQMHPEATGASATRCPIVSRKSGRVARPGSEPRQLGTAVRSCGPSLFPASAAAVRSIQISWRLRRLGRFCPRRNPPARLQTMRSSRDPRRQRLYARR